MKLVPLPYKNYNHVHNMRVSMWNGATRCKQSVSSVRRSCLYPVIADMCHSCYVLWGKITDLCGVQSAFPVDYHCFSVKLWNVQDSINVMLFKPYWSCLHKKVRKKITVKGHFILLFISLAGYAVVTTCKRWNIDLLHI